MKRLHLFLLGSVFVALVTCTTGWAQGTVQRFTRIFINGGELTGPVVSGVRHYLPATSGTLLSTANMETVGVIRRTVVTLTDAQVKALPTTGITALSAPASGSRVKLIGGTAKFVIVGAYTNINATYSDIHLEYGTSAKYIGLIAFDDSTTGSYDVGGGTTDLTIVMTTVSQTLTDIVPVWRTDSYWLFMSAGALMATTEANANTVRVKSDNSGGGNFTGGNASNTLTLTLYYAIETL